MAVFNQEKFNPVADWPKELIPEPRSKMLITVEIEINPPEEWNDRSESGLIIMPPSEVETQKFAFKIHEIVAISADVKENFGTPNVLDMNYAPELNVGDWVVIVQAQNFVHLAQTFHMCAPQFIGARIKEAKEDWQKVVGMWNDILNAGKVKHPEVKDAKEEEKTSAEVYPLHQGDKK